MDISLRAAFVVLGVIALLGLAESEITVTPLTADLAENSAAGTTVTTLTSTGDTEPYTYALEGDQEPNKAWFVISTAGVITVDTGKTIDYEAGDLLTGKMYKITVKVEDSTAVTKISATATVIITITDVNECPSFATDGIIFNTSTPLDKDTEVGQITATDPDASGQITYGLAGQDDKFSIAATGAITAKVKLSGTETYTMVATAKDDDSTPLTCSTYVVVCVGGCSTACPNGAISLTGSVLSIAGVLIFIFV